MVNYKLLIITINNYNTLFFPGVQNYGNGAII